MNKQIIYRKLDDLTKLHHNPRQIAKKDMERLKKSIADNQDYFEARPIILSDRTGELVIIAGNQRYEAAKSLGMDKVPTFLLSGLTEEREKEIIIRDNVANGDWDMDILANEWDIETLRDWGVDMPEYKEIVEDEAPDVDDEQTFSAVGNIYKLGNHRVFCGSFDDDAKIRELFGDKKATCTFTDPPYNIGLTGRPIINDSQKDDDYYNFMESYIECAKENTTSGGCMIFWTSNNMLFKVAATLEKVGIRYRQLILWVKDNFMPGRSDIQNQTETAVYGMNEGKYDKDVGEDETSNYEIGFYCRDRGFVNTKNRQISNVWFFGRPRESKEHPTMKPTSLCAKGILLMCNENDIVFDMFLGSGSTLIAAEQTGRVCYGCEIDPKYCDVIRKRYWQFVNGSDEGWQEGTSC